MINRTDFLISPGSPWVNVFFSANNCGFYFLRDALNYHQFWPELLLQIRIEKNNLMAVNLSSCL